MYALVACLLLSITKLQNLKAIHSGEGFPPQAGQVVINRKTTKFESNSQQQLMLAKMLEGCYQSQNYKIWKQFTTYYFSLTDKFQLLSITKLQNLKAIHNTLSDILQDEVVVINHKTTKFESNSQHISYGRGLGVRCYQSQNYKIWKQFTTCFALYCYASLLLSITKL